jgi:adenosine kinase
LRWFIERADIIALNDYEARLLVERTGSDLPGLARQVRALVVTRGGEGSAIHVDGRVVEIPVARPVRVVDPTGCGDAYRAGLLHGIASGMDWETTGRLAALMGTLKIECAGAQNHAADRAVIGERFLAGFGYRLW